MSLLLENAAGVILSGSGTPGYEPALTNKFEVTFLNSPVGTWSSAMQYAVRSFQTGKKTVDAGDYILSNRVIRYPKKRGPLPNASLDLMIFGGVSNGAYDFFWNWYNLVYNDSTDTVGMLVSDHGSGGVGGSATVSITSPTGLAIAYVELDDIWPCSFGINDLDRSSDCNAVIAQIQFVVNEWNWIYNGSGR
jgi:hypothetical protein